MDPFLQGEHFLSGLVLSFLFAVVVGWIAWKKDFFRLPPPTIFPIRLLHAVGAILTYLLFMFLYAFAAELVSRFFKSKGMFNPGESGPFWMNLFRLVFPFLSFLLLTGYCFILPKDARYSLFWGEREKSWRRFWKSIGMGAIGWVVSYPFVLLIGLVSGWVAQQVWGEVELKQVAVEQLKKQLNTPHFLVLMVGLVTLFIPFLEELLFRGFLQNLFKRFMRRSWAIFLTAALFALSHFAVGQGKGNFQLILSLFVLALFLGFLYERQRTLWAPFALHALFNSVSTLLILMTSG